MGVKEISANDLRTMENSDGLILQGCGGSLDEWVDGINDLLTEEGILLDGTRFSDVSSFRYDGHTCLLFSFTDDVKLDVGKLAMWRIASHADFGGTWLSDYVPNRLGGFIPAERTQDAPVKPDWGCSETKNFAAAPGLFLKMETSWKILGICGKMATKNQTHPLIEACRWLPLFCFVEN